MRSRQDPSALLDSILSLRMFPFFSEVSAAELAPLAYHAQEKRFPAGTIIARQAEIWNQFCVASEGTFRTSTGQLQGIREALSGLALFARSAMPSEVVAEEEVRAVVIPGDAVFEALEDDFHLLLKLVRGLAAQLLTERERLGGQEAVLVRSIAGSFSPDHGLDLVHRMLLIQRALGLQHTNATALVDVARNATPFHVPKGELIWRRGDAPNDVFLIVSGTVSAVYPGGLPLHLGTKILVGILEALARIPPRYDLFAEEELMGLRTSLARFLEALEDHFQMATNVLGALAAETLRVLFLPRSA